MTLSQKHLIDNYNWYVKIFTIKFKDATLAKQGIHNTYCALATNKTIPDNMDVFVRVAIKQRCISEKKISNRKVDKALTYFTTEKQMIKTINANSFDYSKMEDFLDDKNVKEKIKKALSEFKPSVQKIISMYLYEQKTLPEIAEELNKSVDYIKVTYRWNINKLIDIVRKDY